MVLGLNYSSSESRRAVFSFLLALDRLPFILIEYDWNMVVIR